MIILVEDDIEYFRLLKRALWRTGATARVWWARSCEEALETLTQVEASTDRICIVCDEQLPDNAGRALAEALRTRPGTERIKFILLAEGGLLGEPADARKGAICFRKSTHPADLQATARTLQKLTLEV